MYWSIRSKGPRLAVLAQILAMPSYQAQQENAKYCIISELSKDQYWGNTGVDVTAYGHSGKDSQSDLLERHASVNISITHFRIEDVDEATFTVPKVE